MKAPITAAQAMQHPTVVETINTLGEMADELWSERDALLDRLEKAEKDAERYRWLRNGPLVDAAQECMKQDGVHDAIYAAALESLKEPTP